MTRNEDGGGEEKRRKEKHTPEIHTILPIQVRIKSIMHRMRRVPLRLSVPLLRPPQRTKDIGRRCRRRDVVVVVVQAVVVDGGGGGLLAVLPCRPHMPRFLREVQRSRRTRLLLPSPSSSSTGGRCRGGSRNWGRRSVRGAGSRSEGGGGRGGGGGSGGECVGCPPGLGLVLELADDAF